MDSPPVAIMPTFHPFAHRERVLAELEHRRAVGWGARTRSEMWNERWIGRVPSMVDRARSVSDAASTRRQVEPLCRPL